MKYAKEALHEIIGHIKAAADEIDHKKAEGLLKMLVSSKRIFIYGMGRSGLVASAFAMRLAHIDLEVYVVGETTTPAIQKEDTLFLISGSGNTHSVVSAAEVAKDIGAKVCALTSNPVSDVARISDIFLIVKGRTKSDVEHLKKDYLKNQMRGSYVPLTPLGTLFEDACMIFLDAAVVEMMHFLGKTEKDLAKKHANIE